MVFRLRSVNRNSRIVDYRRLHELLSSNPSKEKILITRRPPYEIKNRNVYPIWVTKVRHPNAVSPSQLHVIEQLVWDRLNERNSDVVLDALEYLMIENGVEPILRFVSRLRDMALMNDSEFYVTVSDGLEGRVLNILRRIVE